MVTLSLASLMASYVLRDGPGAEHRQKGGQDSAGGG